MTIGVAAVIILIAVGNGSSKAIEERIESLGTNVLLVEAGATRGGARLAALRRAPSRSPGRTRPPCRTTTEAPDVQERLARRQRHRRDARLQRYHLRARHVRRHHSLLPRPPTATTSRKAPPSPQPTSPTTHASPSSGRPSSKTCSPDRPVGQTMQINGVNFQVIGVTAPRAPTGCPTTTIVARADHHRAGLPLGLRPDRLDHRPGHLRVGARRRGSRGHADPRAAPQSQGHRRTGLRGDQPRLAARNHQLHHLASLPRCSARSRRSRCWWAGSA